MKFSAEVPTLHARARSSRALRRRCQMEISMKTTLSRSMFPLFLLLNGCAMYSTTYTHGPFMDVSWKGGEPQTASAGEQIVWWQYGVRDTMLKTNYMLDMGKVQNDTIRDVSVRQGVRFEVAFNGFKDGQLVVCYREFTQASTLESQDNAWYPRGNSDNLMYFDLSRDSTVTIHDVPIRVLAATPSILTYVIGGMPRRVEGLLPPPGRGPDHKSG